MDTSSGLSPPQPSKNMSSLVDDTKSVENLVKKSEITTNGKNTESLTEVTTTTTMDTSTAGSDTDAKKKSKKQLHTCIIKLTELSNVEREWRLTSQSSSSNSTNSANVCNSSSESHYNMQIRPSLPHRGRTTKHKHPVVNYTEHNTKDNTNESDFEPVFKRMPPLDNKSYPSATCIVMQKEIENNKANKADMNHNVGAQSPANGSVSTTLPVATLNPNNQMIKLTLCSKTQQQL